MKRTKKLYKIKKLPFWKYHVPIQDIKSFLQMEEAYTRIELINFYMAFSSEEKEKYRKIVIDKRLAFLKKYMAGNIKLKEYDKTEQTVFEMFREELG